MKATWVRGWENRVQGRLAELGFESLSGYLEARVGAPYEQLGVELGGLAPIQVLALQYQDARDTGRMRQAAMDSLSRTLVGALPRGWGSAGRLEWPENRALSGWSSEILVTGESPELEGKLDGVIDALIRLAPAQWIPEGPDDSVIRDAFREGWPTGPLDRADAHRP